MGNGLNKSILNMMMYKKIFIVFKISLDFNDIDFIFIDLYESR